MGQALRIVYHTLATHLLKKVGFSCKTAQTGAVTLIQRFGSALNLNIHFHMLFLDGVYVERSDRSVRVRRVKVPKIAEVTDLTHTLAHRIGRFLEQQGLLERDADDCMDAGGSATQRAVAENSYLAGDDEEAGPMDQLLGHSITYRIAVVKAALLLNSAAVIFAHNHPSGVPEPSRADLTLTKRLQDALALVDIRIRVLDHIIVWGVGTVSLAERGL